MSDIKLYDLVIIGGGPTGISCAIAATNKGLQYVVLEKGVLVNSLYHFPTNMTFFSTSKNLEIGDIPFISHNEKPTRKEALEYYRRLAHHYQLNIIYKQKAQEVTRGEDGSFHIVTPTADYVSRNVVIATGFYDNPRSLDVPGADLLKVKHYYDDPHPYIDMNVLVLGGANSACDVALETWAHGAQVTMAIRKPALYPRVKYWILPNIQNRIKEGSIKAHFETELTEITEDAVTLRTPSGLVTMANDYVLAMIGYEPDYALLDQLGVSYKDDEHHVPTHDADTCESNVKGVYLAGVLNGGKKTSSLFIENTRTHGEKIIAHITGERADTAQS